jgi:hypothetical protein
MKKACRIMGEFLPPVDWNVAPKMHELWKPFQSDMGELFFLIRKPSPGALKLPGAQYSWSS